MKQSDIERLSTEQIERRVADLTYNVGQIKNQIEQAKLDAKLNGNYSDPDWFQRANHAARMLGREHQMLLLELAKRKKSTRRQFNTRLERAFMDTARLRLDPDLFRSILDEAYEIADTSTNGESNADSK